MTKIIIVEKCQECPYLGTAKFGFIWICHKQDREIEIQYETVDRNCPLKDLESK